MYFKNPIVLFKIVLSFLIIGIGSFGFAQNIPIKKITSLPATSARLLEVDHLGSRYFLEQNSLIKISGTQKWEYKNLTLGPIHSLDVINPLKVVVFYKDFNTVMILDNQLSPLQSFTLSDLNLLASTCTMAGENKLWIYDQLSSQLCLLDTKTLKVTYLNQPFSGDFKAWQSDFNTWQIINSENHLISFDLYGRSFKKLTLPDFDQIHLTQSGKIIFSLGDNLYLYQPELATNLKLLSAESTIEKIRSTEDFLWLWTTNTITNYQIKLP